MRRHSWPAGPSARIRTARITGCIVCAMKFSELPTAQAVVQSGGMDFVSLQRQKRFFIRDATDLWSGFDQFWLIHDLFSPCGAS